MNSRERRKQKQGLRMYRQGDVLLMPLEIDPTNERYTEVLREEDGGLVLQWGEVTGHKHQFREPGVCMLRSSVASDPIILRVLGDEGANLLHEEHATIHVPRGTYGVVIQEEFTPDGWERVID